MEENDVPVEQPVDAVQPKEVNGKQEFRVRWPSWNLVCGCILTVILLCLLIMPNGFDRQRGEQQRQVFERQNFGRPKDGLVYNLHFSTTDPDLHHLALNVPVMVSQGSGDGFAPRQYNNPILVEIRGVDGVEQAEAIKKYEIAISLGEVFEWKEIWPGILKVLEARYGPATEKKRPEDEDAGSAFDQLQRKKFGGAEVIPFLPFQQPPKAPKRPKVPSERM